jgi:uracil phosphoribosyltransferase
MIDVSQLRVVEHSIVRDALTRMRCRDTSSTEFRAAARTLAWALAYEATRDLPLEECDIDTPVCAALGARLNGRVVATPILRAGLGMLDGFLDLVPSAGTGYIGLRRDEETLVAHEYYRNVPEIAGAHFFLLDPMLATGGSVLAALRLLPVRTAASCSLLSFIAAPEGVAAVMAEYPDLRIFTGSLDERLNERGYIVPGLGDAGDRLCDTL